MAFRGWLSFFFDRKIRTADMYWRRKAVFGIVNEFFGRQVISADDNGYTLPFLANPFRDKREMSLWQNHETLKYEYLEQEDRDLADKRFDTLWSSLENRLKKEMKILDVGCNTGYFMERLKNLGFENIVGIDPQAIAVAYAKEQRPDLDIVEGFFGPPENDITCDVLIMFKSVFRIPYSSRMFEAIERCAGTYVIFESAAEMRDFCRDLHFEMAKIGFICIEKRVYSKDFIPIGLEGANDKKILIDPRTDRPQPHDCFYSNFIFRRIEPR